MIDKLARSLIFLPCPYGPPIQKDNREAPCEKAEINEIYFYLTINFTQRYFHVKKKKRAINGNHKGMDIDTIHTKIENNFGLKTEIKKTQTYKDYN